MLADVALFAVAALVAEGTVPSFGRLIWVPVIVPFLILTPVTASFLICLVPTVFLPSFPGGKSGSSTEQEETSNRGHDVGIGQSVANRSHRISPIG